MVAAIADTPSFSVKPTATPIAKIKGGLSKTTSPEFFIRRETISGIQPKRAAPTPSGSPATGNTATGGIGDLPIFCGKTNGDKVIPSVARRSPGRGFLGMVSFGGGDGDRERSNPGRRADGQRLSGDFPTFGRRDGADDGFDRGDDRF